MSGRVPAAMGRSSASSSRRSSMRRRLADSVTQHQELEVELAPVRDAEPVGAVAIDSAQDEKQTGLGPLLLDGGDACEHETCGRKATIEAVVAGERVQAIRFPVPLNVR